MRWILKRLFIFLLTIVVAFNITARAQEADFDTTYNIDYEIDNSLVVSVKETIGVINQNSSAVPSSFIETITNISVYDIKVLDSKGKEIIPEIEEKGKELVIKIPIEDPAVGKDKKTQVTLSYKTRDLAQKTGRILNLNIPKAPVSNYMQEYNVTVRIPKDFGPQISITPKPAQEKMEEEGYTLLYNKQTLEKYGISATFGDYQIFDFDLSHELRNDSFFAKIMEVALPLPIKDYQEINIVDVKPVPLKLRKDGDGNVYGVYKVSGKKTVEVEITGKAKVYNKKISMGVEEVGGIPAGVKKYLQPEKYWDSQDETVKQVVQEITDNQKSITANALAIYTYLTDNIRYDFGKAKEKGVLERKGAPRTLQDKNGLCLDFTDTFIALARASGIPAREVDGYAYAKDPKITPTPLGGNNNEFLHSWVQFYNPEQGWVSVDPTWGATSGLDYFSKLDNNHLAFVVKGEDSQSPQPPKQIRVQFSADDFFSHSSAYDLEKLPTEPEFSVNPLVVALSVATLGLCTIFVLSKARRGSRYK